MRNARRSRQLFYAAMTVKGERRLLLGPFAEKAVAETSLHAARELAYLHFEHDTPVHVEVIPVFVPAGTVPPTGELNVLALRIGAPLLTPT